MVAGVKETKLGNLARELPTAEEVARYPVLLAKESDRGAALMAGAFVENTLWVCVCSRIVDPGEVIRKQWFEGPTAPFATFAAKITLGRALAIYGPHMEKRLTLIKNVRNQFAHSSRPLDFSHPAVIKACKDLVPDGEKYERLHGRQIYVAAALALAQVLAHDAAKHGGQEMATSFP